MAQLKTCGIEVIALADHHTAAWYDVMRLAGERAGITVFPGVEVTTSTGSDGVHLLLIGDLVKTARDIDILLAKTCGFNDEDHPRFDPTSKQPAPSPRSVTDILDDLPDGWLAIGPHALGDNGIASGNTVKGSNRWKALHHDRLAALDVGECNGGDQVAHGSEKHGFNLGFRNRTLEHFPCLTRLAFISTSDAYSLDRLGTRHTWIRMAEPSFEALRQAFLDHEARVIRDSDPKRTCRDDPNEVDHGWIESISLAGKLGNSATPLKVNLHPRLNVVIGGRGSGKSTVVAGLRQIYGSVSTLPDSIKAEADDFVRQVFGAATVSCVHHLPISGEQQEATWTAGQGSVTNRGGTQTPTAFAARILAQKELYERTKPDTSDPYLASRNLLFLVDEAIEAAGDGAQSDFDTERIAAEYSCQNTVQARLQLESALGRRDELTARRSELIRQIDVLDDPGRKARRDHNTLLMQQRADLEAMPLTVS